MYPHIQDLADNRCRQIAAKRYDVDPGLSPSASKASATIHAFYAGEADVIAATIAAVLRDVPYLDVFEQYTVNLPDQAFKLVKQSEIPNGVRVRSDASGEQRVIDLVVLDARTRHVVFYEIKRGSDNLNSDQKRQCRRTNAVLRLIGTDFARRTSSFSARHAEAAVISYFGRTGLPPRDQINGDVLDDTLGISIQPVVEEHLHYFRQICEQVVPGMTAVAT